MNKAITAHGLKSYLCDYLISPYGHAQSLVDVTNHWALSPIFQSSHSLIRGPSAPGLTPVNAGL